MTQDYLDNGKFEVTLNEDRTVAFATIYPPRGGESATVAEVRRSLTSIGVAYGINDHAIREAILASESKDRTISNVMVAEGEPSVDGKDAEVEFTIPIEVLSMPLPPHPSLLPIPDWFALDERKLVTRGQQLALISREDAGTAGRTLTWPIKTIPPRPGKPASIIAGDHVHEVENVGLVASCDGYACLAGEILTIYPVQVFDKDLRGEQSGLLGVVVRGHAIQADIRTSSVVAIKGVAVACKIRADEDIIISYAENCEIATAGSVYVLQGLKNCTIVARTRVVACGGAVIQGGTVKAGAGLDAVELGSQTENHTTIITGSDHFSVIRSREIQEELSECEANFSRITHALQPFTAHNGSVGLSDAKREMLHKLQLQKRTLDLRINQLHTERRLVSLLRHEISEGKVNATGVVWPGVSIDIRDLKLQIDASISNVRFQRASNGKSIEVISLLESAA